MRKLKLLTQLSIDGFIADTSEKTDWMIWNWGPDWHWDDELKKDFNSIHATVDCILLSRKMAAEGFIGYWSDVAINPEPQYDFARKINGAHKVIFTKTLCDSTWVNASLAKGEIVDEITKLKNQTGKDIIAYGGATFASSLIKAGVIDEYHLLINPVILGEGLSIFHEVQNKLDLKLIQSKAYRCGMSLLKYSINQ